jgi:hypothetical protein
VVMPPIGLLLGGVDFKNLSGCPQKSFSFTDRPGAIFRGYPPLRYVRQHSH